MTTSMLPRDAHQPLSSYFLEKANGPLPLSSSSSSSSSPTSNMDMDITALSGILGSISIACWVVVFTPQIIENFRRSSAEGLSLAFIIIWLAGDVFNIAGAVLQGVLPTMTILAVYYTLADVVLLGQCVWYCGWRVGAWEVVRARGRMGADEEGEGERRRDDGDGDEVNEVDEEEQGPTMATEESPLLAETSVQRRPKIQASSRTSEASVNSKSLSNHVDATRLSPATPFLPPPEPTSMPPAAQPLKKPRTALWAFLFNTSALVVVCLAGVLGWYLSSRAQYTPEQSPSHRHHHHHDHESQDNGVNHYPLSSPSPFSSAGFATLPHLASTAPKNETLHFDLWGQIFGYLCAVLYLGSRIPQLLLNFRRKSTDGVSLLFFLFACVGNLTYVLSIFAYEPDCARVEGAAAMTGTGADTGTGCRGGEWREEYGRYILVNTSWLVGSAGTLVLDLCIFVQIWIYRGTPKSVV